MSNEAENSSTSTSPTASNPEPSGPIPAPAMIGHHVQIREVVKTQLKETGGAKVRGLVVTHLEEEELLKRKAAVLAVLVRLDEQHRNIGKLEGSGTVLQNREGKPIGEPTFTKDQVKTLKEAREAHTKLQGILNAAFEKDEWNKLIDVSKQGGGAGPNAVGGPNKPGNSAE